MKFTITLVVAFSFLYGCASVTMLPAFADSAADTWPILYIDAGVGGGRIALYDQNASAWQQRSIRTLPQQFTPQRNAIGWDSSGKWNATFIEPISSELETWESPDDGWQDDAGAWALTDADNTHVYLSADVETRQNNIFAVTYDGGLDAFFIDLAAGGPVWTSLNTDSVASGVNQYSIVLDRNLMGTMSIAYADGAGNIDYGGIYYSDVWAGKLNIAASQNYPQIVVDSEQRFWVTATASNNLSIYHSLNNPFDMIWLADVAPLYAANALTDAHHSSWRKIDDSIHVVLVDYDDINPNGTFLIYLRRTPNGWTAPMTLLIVDSLLIGDNDRIIFPQICNATDGSLFVSYILEDVSGTGGDLQGFYLDAEDYDNYTVVGAGGWIAHTNIDGAGAEIFEAVMPDYIPISGKI